MAATPGRMCIARTGSSSTRPRRFCRSALPSTCWAGTPVSPGAEQVAGHLDAFGVGARAFGEGNDEVDGPALADADVAPDHDEADDRHREHMRTRRDVGERELAARVGEHRSRLPLNLHAHVGEPQAGDAVDDLAGHRRPRLRAGAGGQSPAATQRERGVGPARSSFRPDEHAVAVGLALVDEQARPERLEVLHRELLGAAHAVERAVAERHLAVFAPAGSARTARVKRTSLPARGS